MDAVTQLALMTKAKLVFESENTFLTFPALSIPTYSTKNLSFDKASTPEALKTYAEFSREVNIIPRGPVCQLQTEETLWEAYADIFKNADLAESTLSADEKIAYEKARSFLYVQTADGLHSDSPQLVLYKQYRDAQIKAHEEYLNRKTTAEASTDPAVKTQWDEDEPLLRQQLQQIESDWENLGFRSEVEQAQRIEEQYASRSPELQWKEWQSSFNPNLDMPTDTDNQPFAISSFSPYDIFDHDDWPTFELSNPEVKQLVAQAPPELAKILASGSTNSTIDKISFEYRSVSVTRPWFKPEVFSARFWRFTDPSQQLSDGEDPPSGRCPAYVAGLVFVRNIKVQSSPSAGERHQTNSLTPVLRTAMPGVLPHGPKSWAQMNTTQRALILAQVGGRPVPVRTVAAAHGSIPVAHPVPIRHTVAVARPAIRTLASPIRMSAVPALSIGRPIAHPPIVVHPPAVLHAPVMIHPPIAPTVPVPLPSGPVVKAGDTDNKPKADEVHILAFICKRLGKTPNPDPDMQWSS